MSYIVNIHVVSHVHVTITFSRLVHGPATSFNPSSPTNSPVLVVPFCCFVVIEMDGIDVAGFVGCVRLALMDHEAIYSDE